MIMLKATSRVRETTHNHGDQVPRNTAEVEALDKANGSMLWRDISHKEIKELSAIAGILENVQLAPKFY